MQINDKILKYLGLAARGRLMVNGYNTCLYMIEKGKVKLLILAKDLSENSSDKLMASAVRAGVLYIQYGTKESLSHAAGKTGSGVFGITDENLAKAISAETIRHGSL